MGRIKTKLIKRYAHDLFENHADRLSNDFEENKKSVSELLDLPGKKLRNILAGSVTKLMKNRE